MNLDSPKTMPLPVALSTTELAVRADELAAAVQDLDEMEDNEKSRAKEAKDEIKDQDAKVAKLANVVRTGSEYRQVEVEERCFYERRVIETIRKDLGTTVSMRPMTDSEAQLAMDLKPALQIVKAEKSEPEITS